MEFSLARRWQSWLMKLPVIRSSDARSSAVLLSSMDTSSLHDIIPLWKLMDTGMEAVLSLERNILRYWWMYVVKYPSILKEVLSAISFDADGCYEWNILRIADGGPWPDEAFSTWSRDPSLVRFLLRTPPPLPRVSPSGTFLIGTGLLELKNEVEFVVCMCVFRVVIRWLVTGVAAPIGGRQRMCLDKIIPAKA